MKTPDNTEEDAEDPTQADERDTQMECPSD
jgi:hypothetical protein